jgi:hypothetical protein
VAWRFLAHLSEHDLIEHLLHELPTSHQRSEVSSDVEASDSNGGRAGSSQVLHQTEEHTPLLRARRLSSSKGSNLRPPYLQTESRSLVDGGTSPVKNDLSLAFVGLNALEVAAVANAKKFLSQQVVQKVVNNIWSGDIVFWDSLNVNTKKKAQLYNKRYAFRALILSPSEKSATKLCLHYPLRIYLDLVTRAFSRSYSVFTTNFDFQC